MTEAARPFCEGDPAARAAFDAWVRRLDGLALGEAELYVVGLLASREVRLEQLARAIAGEVDGRQQLALVEAERRAAAAVAASLDHLDRVLGVAGEAVPKPAQLKATGTAGAAPGRVISFQGAPETRPKSALGQRLAAAVARAGAPMTMAGLRRAVAGSEGDFRRGLRDALACGAIRREGSGSRGRPYLYRVGGSR